MDRVKFALKRRFEKMLRRIGYSADRRRVATDDQFDLVGETEKPVIFDIGAHRGRTIKRYLKRHPQAEIHAFEPIPDALRDLEARYAGCRHIKIIGKAVGERVGCERFHINTSEVQSSLLKLTDIGKDSYLPHDSVVDIEIITLDDYCRDAGVDVIDILKMDIQGAELMALKGGQKLLQRHAVSVLYFEVWFKQLYQGAPHFLEIADYLQRMDYQLFNIYKLRHDSNKQLIKADVIFISPETQKTLDEAHPHWSSASKLKAEKNLRDR